MMRGFKDKLLLISTVLLVIGVISLILENTFYQYVDKNGLLHESLFLPLGTFSVVLGGFGILATMMFKVWVYKKESTGNNPKVYLAAINLLALMIYGIGLMAPLTPSERLPSFYELIIFLVFPMGLLGYCFYKLESIYFKIIILIQFFAIASFSIYLLILQYS